MGLIFGTDGLNSIYCGVKHLGLTNIKQESVHYGAEYLGHSDLSQYIAVLVSGTDGLHSIYCGVKYMGLTNSSQYIIGLNIWSTQT